MNTRSFHVYNMIMKVPLASSGLREIDINAAIGVLNSGKLTMGEQVAIFESKMASYLQVEHFVMVNSGSSANLLIIEALLRPTKSKPKLALGDGILVPAIAWPTTIWPLIQLGLKPIFVDVSPSNIGIDLNHAQEIIDQSNNTVKGLFPIHPLGFALSPSELVSFTDKNDLVLINDVCESLGSWTEGKHAGTIGVASSFSFYFSHHITTMEGGGIATNSNEFADDLRAMRSHGWSRDRYDVKDWTSSVSENDSKFLFVSTGYNVRPMEIQAAIGSLQIESIDNFVDKRRSIVKKIKSSLENTCLEIIGLKNDDSDAVLNQSSWMLVPLQVKGEYAKNLKSKIVEELQELGIETRPVLTGNFLSQPAIKRITKNKVSPDIFRVASEISDTAFLVGCHHDLSTEQIEYLCKSLKEIANKSD
jgi:CDP-6-deoxy-D-xylo-4-hexulose-3-dehydrase